MHPFFNFHSKTTMTAKTPASNPEGAPPPYGATGNPQHQDITATKGQAKPGQDGAGGGQFFFDQKELMNIELYYYPELHNSHLICAQPWCGHMFVKCHDVPRLMREGFYWTTANVLKEEGSISIGLNGDIPRMGMTDFTVSRDYYMTDLQQPPRWVAQFVLYSTTLDILRNINLDGLSIQRVHAMFAWSRNEKLIYHFQSREPQLNFNAIYDDMRMEGWWPWPRKEE